MLRYFLPCIILVSTSALAIEVVVSPDGPVKSLLEARDAIRKARETNPDETATITVKSGSYTQTTPLAVSYTHLTLPTSDLV